MDCTTIKIVLWVLNIFLLIVLIRRNTQNISNLHDSAITRMDMADPQNRAVIDAVTHGKADTVPVEMLMQSADIVSRRASAMSRKPGASAAQSAAQLDKLNDILVRKIKNKTNHPGLSRRG
ncbi:hypothetical protein EOVG_00247 [Emiliania huxleyi virus 88]|nr:hypothetical protein EOVG_00247 [Emiliania huxleyi virus 88]